MMAAMLKSVAFPLSPFVGIPPRARDDTYSYAFSLSLLRSSYSDRSVLPLCLSRPLGLAHLVARSSTFLSSLRKVERTTTLTCDKAYYVFRSPLVLLCPPRPLSVTKRIFVLTWRLTAAREASPPLPSRQSRARYSLSRRPANCHYPPWLRTLRHDGWSSLSITVAGTLRGTYSAQRVCAARLPGLHWLVASPPTRTDCPTMVPWGTVVSRSVAQPAPSEEPLRAQYRPAS